jgi:hypothetical protein
LNSALVLSAGGGVDGRGKHGHDALKKGRY